MGIRRVKNPDGSHPKNGDAKRVVDGKDGQDGGDSTQWIDANFHKTSSKTEGNTSILQFTLSKDVDIRAYEIVTAQDLPKRDPVSWRLEYRDPRVKNSAEEQEKWLPVDEQQHVCVGIRGSQFVAPPTAAEVCLHVGRLR